VVNSAPLVLVILIILLYTYGYLNVCVTYYTLYGKEYIVCLIN